MAEVSGMDEWSGADAFRGEFEAMQGAQPAFDIAEVMARFAPEVHLHPDDSYRPASIDWYLDRTRLRLHRRLRRDLHALERGEVTRETLPLPSVAGQNAGGPARSGFFLQIPNDGAEVDVRGGALSSAECYVHVRPVLSDDAFFDIQYWFFYAYNGAADRHIAHEGDWEHVTVRVTNDAQPAVNRIYFGAHSSGDGGWRSASGVASKVAGNGDLSGGFDWSSGGRPMVFSANGSHASYPSPGDNHRRWPKAVDRTRRGGQVWDTSKSLRLVAVSARPADGNEWLTYSGRWGEIGLWWWKWAGHGPFGPAYQRSWYVE